MEDRQRRLKELDELWATTNRQLEELANGKVHVGELDVKARESELLGTLDQIEYEIGILQRDDS